MAKKIEMLNDQQEVVHPLTSSDCVIMENGKTLEEVMGDGIATPTVTHEGASFQVGVGDSNIEVVDGDVASMTLEGQTYQNILPKPTTLIMETDEQEFKINDKIDNNIVLDDNIAEIATVKGQTYVNVVQEESSTEYTVLGEELSGQSIATSGKPEGVIKNATLEGMTLVNTIQEPSEATSVVLDLDADINSQSATIDNTVQGGIHGARLNGMTLVNLGIVKGKSISNTWGYVTFDTKLIKPSTKYYYKLFNLEDGLQHVVTDGNGSEFYNSYSSNKWSTFTTSTTEPTSFEYFTIHIKTSPTQEQVKNIQLLIIEYQDGMENWDIPYFEGMKSVEVPSVKTTGKNLFDGILKQGYIGDATGEANTSKAGVHSPNYMKVKPNTTYIRAITGSYPSGVSTRVYFYDMNKTYLGIYKDGTTFTTPENTQYMRFRYYVASGEITPDSFSGSNIQIEEGSTATSYEPYQSSTAMMSNILLIGGGYTNGYIADDGAVFTTSNDFYTNDYTPIQPNMKLTTNAINLYYYDENKNWIGRAKQLGFTAPSNAKYIKAQWGKTQGIGINDLYVQEAVTLRKVGNVQDELDLETGKLTQRISEFIFDGSEDITKGTDDDGYINTTQFFINRIGKLERSQSHKTISNLFSNKFVNGDYEHFYTVQNRVIVFISKSKLESNDVLGFTKWLQANNIIIQQELATPIIKTVDLSIVDQSNNSLKTIQTQPTLTHITTSSNGLTPFVTIPSQLKYPTIIKPSTQYTLKLKRDVVDSANQLTVNVGGVSTSVTSDIMTITTPDTLTSQDIIFTGKNNVISKLQLIEGDVTGIDCPYFEGMLDVKSPKLLATGKNLFDGEYELDKYLKADGTLGLSTGWATIKNYISVRPNTTYTQNIRMDSPIVYVVFYDKNKNIIGAEKGLDMRVGNFAIYTTPNNCYYIKTCYNYGYIGNHLFQVEEGSVATSYEPYKGVTIEQDIDPIPLTSGMFEQGGYNGGSTSIVKGMSVQQFPISQRADRIKSKTLIKVKPNTTYSINDLRLSAITFDKNGGYNNIIDFCTSFTTDSNTYYLGINLSKTGNSDITPSSLDSLNLTLQEVTDEIVLRSLPNGIKDTLNLTTGEYVQRVGENVIDSSAYWDIYRKDYHGVGKSTFQAYCTKDVAKTSLNDKIYCDILCQGDLLTNGNIDVNKYPCNYIHNYTDGSYTVNRFFVSVNKEMFGCTSNDDYDTCFVRFKAWVKDNPITVQYPLATPIIKKVNLTNTTKLASYASTTHYDTIVPSNSLVPNIKIPSTVDYNVAIKPSTQYTIRANTTSAMSVDLGGSVGTLANGKVTLTTPSTLAHNSLKLGNGKAKEVMVIEGNEIKDNVPFFSGMKNVQMGGVKLVNIARFKNVTALVSANANKTQFTYTGDGSDWGYVMFDNTLLKPNTRYTVYMNVITITSDNSFPIKITYGHNTKGYLDVTQTGIFKKAITTLSEENGFDKSVFSIAFRPCTSGGQVVIQNPMIIEGDWTHLDEIPYIESEMIIEQPIIRSQGKNLFDKNEFAKRVVALSSSNSLNGDILTYDTTTTHDKRLIDGIFKPNTQYTIKLDVTFSVPGRSFYVVWKYRDGTNNSAQGAATQSGQTISFTLRSQADKTIDYFYTSYGNGAMVSIDLSKVQLEEGSTPTSYEPFKHQTLYSNRVIGYEKDCYYNIGGAKTAQSSINSMLADVEGLSIAYVTGGSSNYTFWDKDDAFISGKQYLDTSLSSYDKNGFITVPSNAKYMRFAAGGETNAQPLYKVATVTGELPLRSLPNGVCDTLNLVTGEYVQRIGEVVLDGSSDEAWTRNNDNDASSCFYSWKLKDNGYKLNGEVSCDYFKELEADRFWLKSNVGIFSKNGNKAFYLVVTKDMLSAYGNSISNYLLQNPITVQFELATPIVRKIGLTAKGNYKEIELNGRNIWTDGNSGTNNIKCARYYVAGSNIATICPNVVENSPIIVDNVKERVYGVDTHGDYEYISFIGQGLYYQIYKDKLQQNTVDEFRKWLSQNPLKIGYLSTDSASLYSNIQKPIFFNNVNVQFMNNNIDVQPTLTLQARSRNSYIMDMMKPNTLYTSKFLQSANGSTFIDGTVVSMKINNTFTSPSTLTNKLMITPLNRQEFMIIEGDVTRFTIPYYKGIRSAYDNTDKVEVLSMNKNLFDINNLVRISPSSHTVVTGNSITFNCEGSFLGCGDCWIPTEIGKNYTISLGQIIGSIGEFGSRLEIRFYNSLPIGTTLPDSVGNALTTRGKITTTAQAKYMRVTISNGRDDVNNEVTITDIQVEKSSSATSYIQHAHNSTIINMSTRWETVEVVKVDRVKDMEIGAISHGSGANMDSSISIRTKNYIPVQPNMQIIYCNNGVERATHFMYYDINKNFIGVRVYESGVTSKGTVTTPDNCYFIRLYHGVTNVDNLTITKQQYKPIALNSLPNGVKDELIINRATSSSKLIRRVGKVVLDGSESWTVGRDNQSDVIVFKTSRPIDCISTRDSSIICNLLPNTSPYYDNVVGIRFYSGNGNVMVGVRKNETVDTFKQWLKQNPITVYYELAEPVVTEISLKGYPYVYKDGSVQLNTEIPHTTKVKYNVNQEHLINGQNETIIRHDKQIDNLYDYIELYLEEEYRMELFRMQLELSL